jgi:hypothetical protein
MPALFLRAEDAPIDRSQRGAAAQRHRRLELAAQDTHHAGRAGDATLSAVNFAVRAALKEAGVIATPCVTLRLSGQQSSMSVAAPAATGPARDLPKGAAAITGKVVAVESGKPIHRVQISLSSPDFSEARAIKK